MGIKGRTPNAAEATHMNRVQELGCICCRIERGLFTPAEIHHIDGKTKPGAHLYVLPLCYFHHRAGLCTDDVVSRHPYKKRFEQRYGTEQELHNAVAELLEAA